MGGAQRSLANIARELAQHHRVWVVIFNRDHALVTAFAADVLSLDVRSGRNPMRKIIAFFQRVVRLRQLKKKLAIDVCISFLEGADYVNVLSQRGERVLISVRGSKLHDENMIRYVFFWRQLLIRLLYRRAHGIVCVSPGIKNELATAYGLSNVPTWVIPNFYSVDEIQRLAQQPLDNPFLVDFYSGPVIAMSGRLAIEKGNALIVRVVAQLKKEFGNVRLLLIGDGPQRHPILALAEELGLTTAYRTLAGSCPDVFVTGEVSNVFPFLHRASVYVLNSSSEGFPNGLVEAMACGLPVVSSDCPYGPREIMTGAFSAKEITAAEITACGLLLPVAGAVPEGELLSLWHAHLAALLRNEPDRQQRGTAARAHAQQYDSASAMSLWQAAIHA